jgi:hypothetical protein
MTSEEHKSRNYVMSCVSCGGPIQVIDGISSRHNCSKRHNGAQKAADTRAYDDVPTRRNQTLFTRLKAGFEMLADEDE